MSNITIKNTADGSHTLYNNEIDETYHSTHGAIQEANHVFIQNGISLVDKDKISVLEVGFGTGLNAILTHDYAKISAKTVEYLGLESYPLGNKIISQLNYKSEIENFDLNAFTRMHEIPWDESKEIDSFFYLNKMHQTLQDFTPEKEFDVIYYDAFGPRAQAEMWEKNLFKKLYETLSIQGILVTYCAMGQFKRDLKAVGFQVECVPGPPGKREMTIAHRTS
ncbi:MAG: tRNA (5-methylaminomethyl-2-thiouridine)(34)-methyltransferase MnmD [Flavobacteriales bacterium]